ncbi:tRNA (adenosine(37)-N6)-threonylcarbamoyltransferase complex ATPase subunit type 1 TsaE [Natronosporangium hydrolyticum]|uniref:tRNA threonylcarbamoyladenosine biosynthesis protein TsaE n=1 Tax=Natronosporangium hydrolyticum TaxID=2811111 RepID=A0A895YN80_9ACTN|nr:tRNA (adenosine(37)-N6)-threonylcarbamoyltransferase complex ATPase subunit type 1 TsaE [Natronosporangium hydrolyticum]QSB15570.1 tRNA (adenosine(37)-N6)-threonylcarbamoyltransferase complex ATPase subunit type 1 TsaE [Natronosporangium hydrolyticum]
MTAAHQTAAYQLASVSATRQFGRALAAALRPGDLVVLTGPLGAGKTVLAQGLGEGLGVVGPITSPTFVIARVHRPDPAAGGTTPLVHVDAYRLGIDVDPRVAVDDLDLDATAEESVTVVEWGEGVVEQLAPAHLRVRIDRREDDIRTVTLTGGGDWPERLVELPAPVECDRAGSGD